MKRFRSFVSLTSMGGLLVILPVTIFVLLVGWIIDSVAELFAPVSEPILQAFPVYPWLADLLVILALLTISFVVGLMLRTALGRWVHQKLDSVMIKIAPGYRSIREMIHQFLGDSDSSVLKGDVVIARIFGADNPTTITGIVTSRHGNGTVTVYVPTAPIPTSGMVYHMPEECVTVLEGVSIEEAMRTVISCGAGSGDLFERGTPIKTSGTSNDLENQVAADNTLANAKDS